MFLWFESNFEPFLLSCERLNDYIRLFIPEYRRGGYIGAKRCGTQTSKNFFKKKYTAFKISNVAIQIHRLNVCMWFCVNDY